MALLVLGLLGSASWILPPAFAASLFAGVTSVEASPASASNEQGLHFRADLPFQYQTQVLDADHIVLRLYNARLADQLITPEGGINLLSGGAIQAAKLRNPASNSQSSSDSSKGYQEIVLSGPGLGQKKLKITGAEALPVPVAHSVAHLNTPHAGPVRQQAAATLKLSLKPLPQAPQVTANAKAQEPKPAQKKSDSALFHKLTEQPVAMLAVSDADSVAQPAGGKNTGGPTIASVTDVAGRRNASGMPLVVENRTASPSLPATRPAQRLNAAQPEPVQYPVLPTEPEEEAPEPFYQVLTPLPRYQGGAAPIQAMTTDQNGNTILVRPKNQAIPEFSVASGSGGYNTLFQAESETEAQTVSRLMAQALNAYQNQQFKQALGPIQQAIGIDADNADLYAALAEIQLKLNQAKAASETYGKAFKKGADQYGQRYAQLLVLSGQREQAITVLKQLYQQAARQPDIAYMLGTLYEEMGQTAEALPYLKQAAQLHPASADIQYNLGLAYELSGDSLLAERHYQKALSLNPKAADARTALSRVKTDATRL
ncbi:tetratricopeptide repeat protein [Vampirovibrio sp.]|uniref:tetratricopeptide repeat protein n=1 Tax=Vampirovibrio sp. TaxID=2717857 RepID=UPI00359330A6